VPINLFQPTSPRKTRQYGQEAMNLIDLSKHFGEEISSKDLPIPVTVRKIKLF